MVSLSGSAGPDLVEAGQEVIEEEPELAKIFATHWSVWMMSMWRQSSGGEPM